MAKLTANSNQMEELNKELQQVDSIKAMIREAADLVDLDPEQTEKKIKATENYHFGETIGLLNLFGNKIMYWPAYGEDENHLIQERQATLNTWFKEKTGNEWSTTLFNRFKKARGYMSFITDDHDAVEAKEPDWEMLVPLVVKLSQLVNIDIYDANMCRDAWNKQALKAANNVTAEAKKIDQALTDHKAMMDSMSA